MMSYDDEQTVRQYLREFILQLPDGGAIFDGDSFTLYRADEWGTCDECDELYRLGADDHDGEEGLCAECAELSDAEFADVLASEARMRRSAK